MHHLITTEFEIKRCEERRTLIDQWNSSDWWRFDNTTLQNLYSIDWFWTPKGSQVEYNIKQIKHNISGKVTYTTYKTHFKKKMIRFQ